MNHLLTSSVARFNKDNIFIFTSLNNIFSFHFYKSAFY